MHSSATSINFQVSNPEIYCRKRTNVYCIQKGVGNFSVAFLPERSMKLTKMSQHVQLMTDYSSGKVLEYLSVIHPSAIHAQNRLDIARAQKQKKKKKKVQQAKETKGLSERNYFNWNPENISDVTMV